EHAAAERSHQRADFGRRADHRSGAPHGRARRRAGAAHLRRIRAPARARRLPGPRLQPPVAARGAVGQRRLPRSAHDRRARPPPAREARARPRRAGADLHRARRRLPLPRPVTGLRSVGTRLTLALALAVAGALGVVYLVVVPSLERNLVNAKVSQLHRALPAVVSQLGSGPLLQDQLQVAAASASARVVVYEVLTYSP